MPVGFQRLQAVGNADAAFQLLAGDGGAAIAQRVPQPEGEPVHA